MTREELAKTIEDGSYQAAGFAPYSGDIQVKVGDELVTIDKSGRAYYCITASLSDKATKEARRRALENVINAKKGELAELESQLNDLEKEA